MAPESAENMDKDKKFLLAMIYDKDTISRAETERLAEIIGGGVTWNACR
jgi:hypothetical protein